jgi:hypothetical protein
MHLCLQSVENRVTNDMNSLLLKPFLAEEVHCALFQMAPTKAPGPDGLPVGFFQKNWDVMGEDICQAILGTLNSGTIPYFLNSTNIALIPKVKNPTKVTDFRPISLCNVLYKVISKVLANRLKKILPHIISPLQSAFVPGRLITDNVLVAYKTLHTMHTRMRGKKGFMAVKLDMSDRTKNSTRQLHESIVVMWLCKCECRTHRESALLKTNFKMPKLKIP